MKVYLPSLLLTISFCSAQSFQWGKRGGSTDILNTNPPQRAEGVYSIATDSNKNIYALSSVGTANLDIDGNPDSGYGDSTTITETALISFSCNGTFRWSKIIGGGGYEQFQSVVSDEDDNVYIAGKYGSASGSTYAQHIDDDVSFGTLPVDPRTLTIIKFNSDGDFQWYRRPQAANISTTEGNSCNSKGLHIDNNGNLYWLVLIPAGTYANGLFTNAEPDYTWYIFKYDAGGNFIGAIPIDMQIAGGFSSSMKFDRNPFDGSFFITANKAGVSSDSAVIAGNVVTHGVFIAKFNSQGQFEWKIEDTSTEPGAGKVQLLNLEFDESHIYLGGRIIGLNSTSLMGLSVADPIAPGFVMKITSDGTTHVWSSHNSQTATSGAIKLNNGELAYTSNCAGENFAWGNQTLNASSTNEGTEVLLARFNATSGECINLSKIPGNPGFNDFGSALAVDASNDYIIGGNFASQLTFGNGTISSVGGQSDFFIGKYSTSICSSLGLNGIDEESINVYPNPTNDFVYLNLRTNYEYNVYDLLLRNVSSGKISPEKNSIDLSHLDEGTYFIEVLVPSLLKHVVKIIVK